MARNIATIFALACLIAIGTGFGTKAEAENIYDIQVQPLTVADCGRCHVAHFGWLSGNGGKHQTVPCFDCHEQFHVYNPLKNNYAAIMPKCSQCHDNPHGTAEPVTKCLNCHRNPHEPVASIPDPATLEPNCRICHAPIGQMLAAKPSKHTLRKCSDCHSQKHGRIPNCSECHQSHSPMLTLNNPDCLACHPVHTPLAISYPETQDKKLCGGCHTEIYNILEASKAKHHDLTCAKCHPTHGEIPQCSRCHGAPGPHNPTIHQKFPDCLTCHSNPHDLRV